MVITDEIFAAIREKYCTLMDKLKEDPQIKTNADYFMAYLDRMQLMSNDDGEYEGESLQIGLTILSTGILESYCYCADYAIEQKRWCILNLYAKALGLLRKRELHQPKSSVLQWKRKLKATEDKNAIFNSPDDEGMKIINALAKKYEGKTVFETIRMFLQSSMEDGVTMIDVYFVIVFIWDRLLIPNECSMVLGHIILDVLINDDYKMTFCPDDVKDFYPRLDQLTFITEQLALVDDEVIRALHAKFQPTADMGVDGIKKRKEIEYEYHKRKLG